MPTEELVMFLHTDLSGITRGRSVAVSELAERIPTGVGWVPANASLMAFGPIADPEPWGSIGDVRLRPDPESEVRVSDLPGASPLHFLQCDVVDLDGTGWPACPRVYLRRVLDELAAETGLRAVAAFEQEFHLRSGPGGRPLNGSPFSLEAFRLADRFGPLLVGSLREARLEPETFLAEYGRGQYEVTCRPAPGLQAADRAVAIREVTREVARCVGWRATFTPVVEVGAPASGVHIHVSLVDAGGRPVMHDARGPLGMSTIAAAFAGGVLTHLRAICAFAAPATISYARLTPHNWSSSLAVVGNDREAAIRVPGRGTRPADGGEAGQFNLEFRFPDAAACPHMVLALLVRAGLQGIREGTQPPRSGGGPLPKSLGEALSALESDEVVKAWLPAELLATYRAVKAAEIAHLRDRTEPEVIEVYADAY